MTRIIQVNLHATKQRRANAVNCAEAEVSKVLENMRPMFAIEKRMLSVKLRRRVIERDSFRQETFPEFLISFFFVNHRGFFLFFNIFALQIPNYSQTMIYCQCCTFAPHSVIRTS